MGASEAMRPAELLWAAGFLQENDRWFARERAGRDAEALAWRRFGGAELFAEPIDIVQWQEAARFLGRVVHRHDQLGLNLSNHGRSLGRVDRAIAADGQQQHVRIL